MNNPITPKNPTIFYICNDFERALGLEKMLPNFHIICIDYNIGIIEARKQGVKIFCLEEKLGTKNPIFRNSNRLLQITEVQEYIRNNIPTGEKPNVIFFKIAHNLEQSCKELGYKILNTTADLNQLFELKLSQFEMLKNSKVNFPKTIISSLKDINFEQLIKEIGLPFVIQYDRGHTGSSTVFISNETELTSEVNKYPTRSAKFSQKIEGDAWTLNACVTRFGIVLGGLCYQITGIPECTSKLGGTVGNDWSMANLLSQKSLIQIRTITENAGLTMQTSGYKGLLGLDLVIDKSGEVFLIEINARQPASTGMHSKLMLKENRVPLELLHIAEFLYPVNSEDLNNKAYLDFINNSLESSYSADTIQATITQQNTQELLPKNAAQLIVRNISNNDYISNLKVSTGVYSILNGTLSKIREGFSIESINNLDEILILASENGRTISPEAEIARIQMLKSAMIFEGTNIIPNPEIINIVKQIK